MMNSHDFEQQIYTCECGAWWYGETAAVGCLPSAKKEECPRCGVMCGPVGDREKPATSGIGG